ncbi:MAG: PEP-CTERM system histidine kinase PrsK [Rubrivivax sp.]|nr:PEP-CTERM system histidine kinase PrsK [Rubrivivax sp.]
MGSDPPPLVLLGFVVAVLAHGLLSVRLLFNGYLRRSAGPAAHVFLLAVLASAAWGAAGTWLALAETDASALATALADLARYGAWFGFLLLLLRPADADPGAAPTARLPTVAAFVIGLGGLAAAGTALSDSEPLRRWALFAALAQPVFGLVLVEQLFRNVARDGRWGVKPLCLALAGVFCFDLYIHSQGVLFGSFDQDAFSIRAGIHSLAVPLLFLSSRRQADWRMRLQVSHNAAFFSATLLLAGAYLVFISGIGYYVRYFGGSWGRALQLALLFSAVVLLALLVLSSEWRARLRVLISKNFFAYRYDYREQWLKFTATLSASASPQELGALVLRGLCELVDSPGASLWTLLGDDSELRETAWTRQLTSVGSVPVNAPFVQFLQANQWIVDVTEARRHPERYQGVLPPEWLGEGVWAVVPLIVGEHLTGLVLLAPPHAAPELDWEVRDLLKTASRQAAVFLAQLQATEALLEARKFEAFNRMSAFVVHDLKNIVTQLSLMMKNAKRLHDNPEFQQDMLMTVESSLEKMRRLMLQLREGETPPGSPLGVELQPIVQRIADAARSAGRTLELPRLERVATRGHAERIERVLGHMVQNAFDATPAHGRVWLELTRASGQARVVVGDTGQGMTREFIETRLFKPFNTTKSAGMGIGAYESFQYVRELGGEIQVDSTPGHGTVITLVLPLFQAHEDTGLAMVGNA